MHCDCEMVDVMKGGISRLDYFDYRALQHNSLDSRSG
jgi:hypothetical protein